MSIILSPTNGVTVVKNTRPRHLFHDIAIAGGNTGAITIKGKKVGSDVFEEITDAIAIDIAAPVSVQIQGTIEEYQFTLSGVTGTDVITVTDTSRN